MVKSNTFLRFESDLDLSLRPCVGEPSNEIRESARNASSLAGTMLGFYPVRVLPSKTAIAPVNPTFLSRELVELLFILYVQRRRERMEICGKFGCDDVVKAALNSRIQHLEQRLMDLKPRVQAVLEVLPNRLTADILEQLRISKETLV